MHRIMTFGYDSGWNTLWKPDKVLDISDFAKQLVHDLWLHYTEHGKVVNRLFLPAEFFRSHLYLSLIAWAVSLSKGYIAVFVSE